jgi:exosome complex component RRP41
MGGSNKMKLLDSKGRRLDGRRPDEMRPVTIQAGVLHRANGSAYLEWGGNKVMAAVYGPREAVPRHKQDPTKAIVNCRYSMAAFSVEDRKRPGPDRRSREISKVIGEAFENVLVAEDFPRAMVDVNIEILEAAAGTRCAGLTAASVAMADAGIPMTGMIAACAAGKVDGTVVVDLAKEEDNFGDADLPVGLNVHTGEIVLLQMDGHLGQDEFDTALQYAIKGCRELYEVQKKALLDRYARQLDAVEVVR